MEEKHDTHEELEKLLIENKKLLAENNIILKKLQRGVAWGFWLRLVWIGFLLGLPFVTYFYLVAPYTDNLESIIRYLAPLVI
jgi:hypothetical protein